MEIESLDDLICNLKQNLSDTYCTIEATKTALQDYAKRIHTHAIADITNLSTILSNKADKTNANQSTDGLMSAADKKKLDGIATGATKYVHPSQTARTGKPTSNLTPNFGDIITISQIVSDGTGHVTNANDRKITIPNATVNNTTNGLMIASDKVKLDSIANNANNYTHPTYTNRNNGLYKITVDGTGHISTVQSVNKSDITALGIPAQDTTYNDATTSTHGLMSVADKKKIDGIANNANNYTHPSYTSKTNGLYKITVDNSGHVNGTQNVTKADITALGIPAQNTTYSNATTTTDGLMSAEDKQKLDVQSSFKIMLSTDYGIAPNNVANEMTITRPGRIYAAVLKDGFALENKTISFIINGVTYDRISSESQMGYAGLNISESLPKGDYNVTAIYREDGWVAAIDIKTLHVQ